MNDVTGNILAIDPASQVTGYAVMSMSGNMQDAGLLRPARTRDAVEDRAWAMAEDAIEISVDWMVSHVIIECPSFRVHQKDREKRRGHGLTSYAMAAGIIIGAIRCYARERAFQMQVVCIKETVWTRRISKQKRALAVLDVPGYDPTWDKGLDVADAIGLGRWWLAERKIKEMTR